MYFQTCIFKHVYVVVLIPTLVFDLPKIMSQDTRIALHDFIHCLLVMKRLLSPEAYATITTRQDVTDVNLLLHEKH